MHASCTREDPPADHSGERREGPSWCPEALLKIVGTDTLEVERALLAGELECPGCGARLGPWGSARHRVVRRPGGDERRRQPRRSRCVGCAVTHVLIRTDTLLRRRDLAEVIGAALVAKATGIGHRRAASMLSLPVSTVRGWLRRFAANAEAVRVWFTVLAHDLDPLWRRWLRRERRWATPSKRSRWRPGRRRCGSRRCRRGRSR